MVGGELCTTYARMVKPGRERETKKGKKKKERKSKWIIMENGRHIHIPPRSSYDVSTRRGEEENDKEKFRFDSVDGNERVSRNQHSSGRKEKFTPQNHRAFLFLDDRKRKESRERERERARKREREEWKGAREGKRESNEVAINETEGTRPRQHVR